MESGGKMQNKIIKKGKLLKSDGTLAQKGYATELILSYDRAAIKANRFRIKEWDYYYVGNADYGVALTIDDNSYMGLMGISFLHFRKPFQETANIITPFPMGSVGMPSDSRVGDVSFKNSKISVSFTNDGKKRRLLAHMDKFSGDKSIDIDITLKDEPKESMVIVTPFAKDDKAFYYNQKINCMRADGFCRFDGKEYLFNSENKSLGTLDWGRGVWTYKNTWYWGSLSTVLNDDKTFGFNIGYGFGDTSAASENMLFYDGYTHKLSEVKFSIPEKDGKEDFMADWTFTSDDGRFEMNFKPLLDRFADTNVGIIRSCQHQVFGEFSGTAILDDGTVITLDKELGFAEKVFNKW